MLAASVVEENITAADNNQDFVDHVNKVKQSILDRGFGPQARGIHKVSMLL
jgi:hypothetical protein